MKLEQVLKIQSSSYDQYRMFAFLIRTLTDMGVDYYVDNGNIYAGKGDADHYPCIVAHMDTVHDIVEDLTPIEIGGKITGFNAVTMEQTGIGGDDKVGIYIALRCLQQFDTIKVAFFRDEEVGCEGSYLADMTFFNDCRFVLQCDRKGNSDFVINGAGTEFSGDEFQRDIEHLLWMHEYTQVYGGMTDVMALKENGLDVCVANISCGYYNPHTAQEYVDINDVEKCFNLVCDIITQLDKPYYHKHKKKQWTAPTYSKPTYDRTYYDWDDWYEKNELKEEYENYCLDCWSAPAEKQGMCIHCYSQYYPVH